MRKALFLTILALFATFAGTVRAQTSPPLVLSLNGDLWAWAGDPAAAPVSLTTWGYNEPGVISPDGTRIAYTSLATVVVDAFARGQGQAGGALPSNIWVIDYSGNGIRVADQPAEASFMTDGVPDAGIVRSSPSWSPSGTQIAWAEQIYPTGGDSIVVYDFGSGAARPVVTGLPPAAGVPAPKEVSWGSSGLVVHDIQAGGDGSLTDTFTVYSVDGAPITSFGVGGGGRSLVYWALMQDNGREVMGVLFNDGVWELFDLASGASSVAGGIPEMYSPLNPGTSLALSPTINEQGGFTWRALSPDGTIVAEFVSAPYFVPQRYAVSPDGGAVAYSDFVAEQNLFSDVVSVWRDGAVVSIPNPVDFPLVGGISWAPMAWRVRVGVG